MKLWTTSLAILIGVAVSSPALAQCCKSKATGGQESARLAGDEKAACKATCTEKVAGGAKNACGGKTGCSEACQANCPSGSLAKTGAPVMKCRVGDQTLNCPIEAEKLAKAEEAEITYVVGDTAYTEKSEALEAYTKVLNRHLATLTTVRYAVGDECVACPQAAGALAKEKSETVKYRVASYTFPSQEQAEKAAEAARSAAEHVTVQTLTADGASRTCDPAACSAKTGTAKAACCPKDGQAQIARTTDAGAHTAAKAEKSCSAHAQGATLATGKGDCQQTKGAALASDTEPCCAIAKVRLAMAKIAAAQKAVQEFAAAQPGQKVAVGS